LAEVFPLIGSFLCVDLGVHLDLRRRRLQLPHPGELPDCRQVAPGYALEDPRLPHREAGFHAACLQYSVVIDQLSGIRLEDFCQVADYGGGMPRSLQILRARTSAISEWRGTGTVALLPGLCQIEWLPPSRFREHPWRRMRFSRSRCFTHPRESGSGSLRSCCCPKVPPYTCGPEAANPLIAILE
jgi:hypothetical protein